MKIHQYERLWIVAAMVLIVLFIATIVYGAVGAGVAMIDAGGEPVDPNALDEHPQFSDPGVYQVGEDEYEVYIRAIHPSFIPGDIVVPANSTVTFKVTSGDVIHGFNVVGTNANAMVIPGEVTSMTVEVGEPQTYGIICTEYCGEFHHIMEAELRVVPEEEFSMEEGEE